MRCLGVFAWTKSGDGAENASLIILCAVVRRIAGSWNRTSESANGTFVGARTKAGKRAGTVSALFCLSAFWIGFSFFVECAKK